MAVLTRPTCAKTCSARGAHRAVAIGVPVHVVSAVTGEGLADLSASAPGQTRSPLGSSGVGKSTSSMLWRRGPEVPGIREEDARGRHTTTHRQLVLLPNGRLMLDTPGMRELGLWDAEAGVAATLADIEALVMECRFRDCAHEAEPGCAVQAALADGSLDEGRWRGYVKLQREVARFARKDDRRQQAELRKVWVKRARNYRAEKKQQMREE